MRMPSVCSDDHLAGMAVKMEGETVAVVQQIKVLCILSRAEPKFISDTVPCAHQFRTFAVGQFVGRFRGIHPGCGIHFPCEGIGDVVPVICIPEGFLRWQGRR